MKLDIRKRLYKLKERLYIEAKYLSEYGFGIGTPIKYKIDKQNKRITVLPTRKASKHVAKTTQKTGNVVPVIDIKGQEIKEFFAKHSHIEIEIHKGKILFTVHESAKSKSVDNTIDFVSYKEEKNSNHRVTYAASVREVAKASGFEQLSIFDFFKADSPSSFSKSKSNGKVPNSLKTKALKMLSLFSGCGSMDKGFLDEGYEIVFANDRFEKKALRDYHIQTYRENIGDHIIMQDVMDFKEDDIPSVDFVAAGVPCVTFSALNTKNNFRDSSSILHPIVEQTLNIIKWSKAKAFLIENVERFLTVKKGAILNRFKEFFSNFKIVSKVIDATDLGSAQKRKRAFILGIKDGCGIPELNIPHLSEYRTVSDAWKGIENAPQQDLGFKPTPKMMDRIIHIPPGGNILDVPTHLRAPNKKFTNYCQRLQLNGQSPTITHVQDDAFIHPEYNRYLTVRETARLFNLPDNFNFVGSLTSIFEMLKNAVDYKVSKFLAKLIKKQVTV
ncbi:DNA (cytosine-5-)-methyltransferase [Bacillus mexicanus]|uniref:DNA cytosine methyltransferase n=1 Tax=Bacillus mexicanus TaxID=2834415 RepID=UPI003D192995